MALQRCVTSDSAIKFNALMFGALTRPRKGVHTIRESRGDSPKHTNPAPGPRRCKFYGSAKSLTTAVARGSKPSSTGI